MGRARASRSSPSTWSRRSEAGYITHHATGSRSFTETIRKIVGSRASEQFKYFNSYLNAHENEIDVLVCDEAHRIREHSWNRFTRRRAEDPERPQIDELISVARVSVFLIDDMQVVRRNEIGQSAVIGQAARDAGARYSDTYELEIQFRCGGSDGFVRWVENTLGIRRTANALWSGEEGFDFRVVDSVEELDGLIRARAKDGHSARLMAGYCWPWSDPLPDGTLVGDVEIGGWARPWNAKPEKGRLASEPESPVPRYALAESSAEKPPRKSVPDALYRFRMATHHGRSVQRSDGSRWCP